MRRMKSKGILLLLSALLLLAGCGSETESGKNNTEASAVNAESSEALGTTETGAADNTDNAGSAANSGTGQATADFTPLTVADETGVELQFTKPVERVACVVSLCIDVLAELGLEPIAIGESGVRTIASEPEFYGEKGKSFTSIGGSFFEPNLEDIVIVKPDLVIGLKGAHDTLRDGLTGVSPIYLANPNSYTESIAFLETMGKLTGRVKEAEAAKKNFLDKLAEAKEKSPKNKKALIMFGSDVNFSIVTDTALGGTVLKEVADYPWKVTDPAADPYGDGGIAYSLEKVLEQNPEVLFIESYSYSPGTKPLSEQMAASPLWSKLKAVQDGQVHEVRSPVWGDGRGTRSLGIMLEESMRILYPEKL